MVIERFIGSMARRKNESYLRFSPDASYTIPVKGCDNLPLLLYLHIPFCEELCPYCSFHRVPFRREFAERYFAALNKEILMYKEAGYDFNALYVGGGTPTVLTEELCRTVALIKSNYDVTEVSVETNPNHLDEKRMKMLKEVGVNRLSVGVQTFDDGLLKKVERYHKYGSGDEIASKLAGLQGYFDTLNVDMIFNFPGQTEHMLDTDLQRLISLKVDQVTFYPLMISKSTQKIMKKRFGVAVNNEEQGKRYYEMITGALGADYRPSTAWCFSRGATMIDEYVINYDEYAGLGSGSIGYLNGSIYANTFDIEEYISKVENGLFPVSARRDCDRREKILYDFLMKLFGLTLDLDELSAKHGVNAGRLLLPEISFFRAVGGIRREGSKLTLTPKGQYYWVVMMREFFTSVNNFRDHCRTIANLSLAQ